MIAGVRKKELKYCRDGAQTEITEEAAKIWTAAAATRAWVTAIGETTSDVLAAAPQQAVMGIDMEMSAAGCTDRRGWQSSSAPRLAMRAATQWQNPVTAWVRMMQILFSLSLETVMIEATRRWRDETTTEARQELGSHPHIRHTAGRGSGAAGPGATGRVSYQDDRFLEMYASWRRAYQCSVRRFPMMAIGYG